MINQAILKPIFFIPDVVDLRILSSRYGWRAIFAQARQDTPDTLLSQVCLNISHTEVHLVVFGLNWVPTA